MKNNEKYKSMPFYSMTIMGKCKAIWTQLELDGHSTISWIGIRLVSGNFVMTQILLAVGDLFAIAIGSQNYDTDLPMTKAVLF